MKDEMKDENLKRAKDIVRPFVDDGSISETVFLELVDRIADELERVENENRRT